MERAMTRHLISAAAALTVLLGAASLSAHHGWSGYDSATTLTLTGPLKRVVYGNPHVEVELTAQNKTWSAVLAPPFRMEARGLPNGSLKIGAVVTLVGYPHKTKSGELRAERITVAGKTVELR
jgi:hypothetical protein